jgi:hypothetical protein
MNERIRELWDQAASLETDSSWEGQTRFMEKFAELIVQDCQDNLAWHGHDEAVSQLDWFKAHKLEIK